MDSSRPTAANDARDEYDRPQTGLRAGEVTLSVVGSGRQRRLVVSATVERHLTAFEGVAVPTQAGRTLEGPLSDHNAEAVRAHAAWLTPQPLGLRTSAGVGDRLGLATYGQARAFEKLRNSVAPVFAQQSIREMTRTRRSPLQVLNDATFGCVEAGWRYAVGADADHVEEASAAEDCVAAGFSLFSIDPGRHVNDLRGKQPTAGDVSMIPWEALEDDRNSMLSRYRAGVDVGDHVVAGDEAALVAAAVKYGKAIVHVVELFRRVQDHARHPIEIEVCVDETAEVTSLLEHAYIVTELSRLGVPLVSFAPRYSGSFQKAVPYVGDLEAFQVDFARHAHLARTRGPYKLSLHSGSDKFELYEMAFAATQGAVHLKTSGTSYLQALEVVAEHDLGLLREIYRISRDSYTASSMSYQVVAEVAGTPEPATMVDSAAIELLRNNQTRQILHVGYGEILGAEAGTSENQVADGIRHALEVRREEYARRLERHFLRHLTPFGITA